MQFDRRLRGQHVEKDEGGEGRGEGRGGEKSGKAERFLRGVNAKTKFHRVAKNHASYLHIRRSLGFFPPGNRAKKVASLSVSVTTTTTVGCQGLFSQVASLGHVTTLW